MPLARQMQQVGCSGQRNAPHDAPTKDPSVVTVVSSLSTAAADESYFKFLEAIYYE